MKPFRTPIQADVSKDTLSHRHRFLTLGSCFSDAMGMRLVGHKVQTLSNPFGTVYNPASIHKLLDYAITGSPPSEDGYLEHDGLHLHYDFHSRFAESDRESLATKLQDQLRITRAALEQAHVVILAYGTAFVYTRNSNASLVANCHKQPLREFSKRLLTVEEVTASFQACRKNLLEVNPRLKFLLTVSPVRHVKDTFELNSVSKAILRLACHQLTTAWEGVMYFPAFEIMMDDLRDYRFYKEDMLHPSDVAEQYLWEEFIRRHFDLESTSLFQKWSAIKASMEHRPFHPHSATHQQFLKKTLARLEEISNELPVDEEIEHLKKQLLI